MNNEPVAYIDPYDLKRLPHYDCHIGSQQLKNGIPLYTQDQLEEARKLGMQQERALWNLSASTQEIMDTHPVKELTDEEMKNLIQEYWGDVHIVDPDGYLHEIAFIRAILRKAQEK